MNLGHPVLQDMIQLGCKNQHKIFLAFQSYIELCEVQKAQEVSYDYCTELDVIYLAASFGKENEIYIPLFINTSITPSWIKKFRGALPKKFEGKAIYIILCDSDTTNVIYRVSDGLERPVSPASSQQKKLQKEKKGLVEVEISNLLPALIKKAHERDANVEET